MITQALQLVYEFVFRPRQLADRFRASQADQLREPAARVALTLFWLPALIFFGAVIFGSPPTKSWPFLSYLGLALLAGNWLRQMHKQGGAPTSPSGSPETLGQKLAPYLDMFPMVGLVIGIFATLLDTPGKSPDVAVAAALVASALAVVTLGSAIGCRSDDLEFSAIVLFFFLCMVATVSSFSLSRTEATDCVSIALTMGLTAVFAILTWQIGKPRVGARLRGTDLLGYVLRGATVLLLICSWGVLLWVTWLRGWDVLIDAYHERPVTISVRIDRASPQNQLDSPGAATITVDAPGAVRVDVYLEKSVDFGDGSQPIIQAMQMIGRDDDPSDGFVFQWSGEGEYPEMQLHAVAYGDPRWGRSIESPPITVAVRTPPALLPGFPTPPPLIPGFPTPVP